jgi:hypothetical protein
MAEVLFEEKQRREIRWWMLAATLVIVVAAIWLRADLTMLLALWPIPFIQQLKIQLSRDGLGVKAWPGGNRTINLDTIVRCEAIAYEHSWWRGASGRGMEFPSEVIRLRGHRGVRLDLTDGLHLLLGTDQADRLVELIRELKLPARGAGGLARRVDNHADAQVS